MNIELAQSTRQRSRQTFGRDVRKVTEDIDRRFKDNL